MKVLKRGITKAEEKLIGRCPSCNSIFEAEQSECWWTEDYKHEVTICPVCPTNDISGKLVKMYLETSTRAKNIKIKVGD